MMRRALQVIAGRHGERATLLDFIGAFAVGAFVGALPWLVVKVVAVFSH